MKKLISAVLLLSLAMTLCFGALAAERVPLRTNHVRYIRGFGDGTFRPDAPLRRSETAVMLYRLLAAPEAAGAAEKPAADVAEGAWYYESVTALTALGVIRGYAESDGSVTFRPERRVTRAEFVALLARLLAVPDGGAGFADTAKHWAAAEIAAAVRAGWLRGYTEADGSVTFRPDRTITRAEAVAVLNRALGRAADTEKLEEMTELYYLDVPGSAWYFADVMEASVEHTHETDDQTGAERWTAVSADSEGFAMSDPLLRALSQTAAAQETDQIITVVGERLALWERDAQGRWQRALDVPCGVGKNGLGDPETRREGNLQTPLGDYPITMAFGLAPDPGAALPYRQITPKSYWSSASDETYNTWVESDREVRGEHLADYTVQYRYALVIGFNMNPPVVGRGSGIFLHCKPADHWYTAGCVSVEEADMVTLVRRVGPGARILIAANIEQIAAK